MIIRTDEGSGEVKLTDEQMSAIMTRQGVLASMIAKTDIKSRKHTGMVDEMESMIDALVEYKEDLKRINGEEE